MLLTVMFRGNTDLFALAQSLVPSLCWLAVEVYALKDDTVSSCVVWSGKGDLQAKIETETPLQQKGCLTRR